MCQSHEVKQIEEKSFNEGSMRTVVLELDVEKVGNLYATPDLGPSIFLSFLKHFDKVNPQLKNLPSSRKSIKG